MKSDAWFYGIFRKCPWLFFRLLRLSEDRAADYRFGAAEIKETSLRLDGVFCPLRAGEPYFFLEAQLYNDADFYRNWLAKVLLYCRQYRIAGDWRGLVLFGNRGHEPSLSHGVEEWIASGRIERVYLEELPDYPDISLEVAVLKLAVASRNDVLAKARDLAVATKTAAASVKEPKKLLEIIEVFLVANFPRLTRTEIQTMLQLHDIRESTIFQEGLLEGKLEGMLEGKLEGKLEGIQEGILKDKQALVARLHSKGRSLEEIRDLLDVDDELVRKVLAPRPRDS